MGVFPKKSYPDRIIHSIYLDDHEYTDYHDNVSGISRRSKTRIRWYDDVTSKLFLETKRKTVKVSEKHVIPVNNNHGKVPFDKHQYLKFVRENKIDFTGEHLQTLFPVLEVEYMRSYFELTTDIRMTIDRKIRYRKLYPVMSHSWHRSQVDTVVEFKYPIGLEAEFGQIMRGLPFRVFRHSKYVIGVDNVCVG
jgi:SPX domain protein involved in polyphosphate accumulation